MDGLEKHIALKGTNEGYILIVNEESSIQEIKNDLEELFEHLKKDKTYDKEYDLIIDSGNRILKDTVKESLSETIHESTNFVVKTFKEYVINAELAEKWHKESSPLMLTRTVRNGQIIHSEQDIILIGDIRPGGLIRSSGSVIVIGKVEGTIHAGAKGDKKAIIIAPFLYNAQVRITEHVEFIEKEEEYEKKYLKVEDAKPQMVFLNDLHVIEFADVDQVARIRPEFSKDAGGFKEWQRQL